MKYLLRVFLFNTYGLWIATQIVPGISLSGSLSTTLLAGLVLSVLMILVAPLLRILFIPINILTFGLLSWFVNVIVLYLLTIFVPEVFIRPWTFSGIIYGGFMIPPIQFRYFSSLVVSSLVVTFFTNILHSISEH